MVRVYCIVGGEVEYTHDMGVEVCLEGVAHGYRAERGCGWRMWACGMCVSLLTCELQLHRTTRPSTTQTTHKAKLESFTVDILHYSSNASAMNRR